MFSDPVQNIEQLGLNPNEVVADFGCGGGAYTIAAARALKGTGRVYAIEVQKEILTRLQNTLRESGVAGNVEAVWGNIEQKGGTKIRDGIIDVVIISNVLFQNDDKQVIIDEAKRVLRRGGRLFIVDWTGSFNSMGPRPQHVFPEADARKLVEDSGFTFDRHIDAGAMHYGIVAIKQ